MVSIMTIVACVITLLISLVLPVAVMIGFAVKSKRQGIFSAWLLGAAGFFVTQMLIRLPILTVLQSRSWFMDFAQNHLFIYAFGLAFTAGLFELTGRFLVAKIMEKKLTWKRSLAAGLGHGGIEAMLLIGMTYVNNLIYIIMINSGQFDTMIAQAAGAGADVSQLELIRTQLVGTAPGMFLLAGFERLLAMTGHAAMSVLVCYGVAHRKVGSCVLLCLGIHTLMDLTAGISMVLPQNIAYPIIYAILVVMAVVSVVILRNLRGRWKN
ncbi:MAG: YhfC family intramembrane metalloprotease [Lachnospiraceae bacterium]|nr:YhfC family intramembrane metalloprotease [Lachnospiraceae bacterium]